MFREMRRFKQQLTEETCIEVLKKEKRGVLSVLGDDGYPYGIPMNHWYCPEDGKIYFHGAKEGHKIDAIRNCDKVSYCVFEKGVQEGDNWALHVQSVVVFGRLRPVEDQEKAMHICRSICRKFTDDETYMEQEVAQAGTRVLCLELTCEHMSGKMVVES